MITSRKVLWAILLMAASSFVACERYDGGGSLTGPQYAKTDKLSRVLSRFGVVDTTEVCTIADKFGGSLSFPGGSLDISKNAVQNKTVFCASQANASGAILIHLHAFSFAHGPNDPVTQFKSVIKLTLDLSDADVGDWSVTGSAIKVVWHNYSAGTLDPMPTSQNRDSQSVTANLTHFSDYSPVQD